MRIVAVLNQKGGVGKTTTAVNLGAALALRGRRVLLVDADPQGNLSDHLGIDTETVPHSVYDVLVGDATLAEATVATRTAGLFVVPAHPDLAAAEQELAAEIGRELRLAKAFAALGPAYDWVLLDCPPSLGLLSLNAMAAADAVLITVQTEYFAMRGLGQLDRIVQMVREHVNPRLQILGILPTLVNPVTRLAREVIEEIRSHYGAKVLRTKIRQNVRLAEAPGHQDHIFAYEPHSPGAEDYAALAAELDGDGRSASASPPPTPTPSPAPNPVPRPAPSAGPVSPAAPTSPGTTGSAAAPARFNPAPSTEPRAALAAAVAEALAPPRADAPRSPQAWQIPADLVDGEGRIRMPPPRLL